jgi:hypothetical protein
VANLAERSDVEVRLGRQATEAEASRILALLEDASATVRLYTGRNFAAGTSTVRRRAKNGVIRIGERPVTAVTAVENVDGDAVSFEWDGLDVVKVWPAAGLDWFEREWTSDPAGVYDVTYTAGSNSVPDPIKAVVCQIVGRALGLPPDESGKQSENIAGYGYSNGVAAAAGAAGMLNSERAVLDRYRRVGATIRVG